MTGAETERDLSDVNATVAGSLARGPQPFLRWAGSKRRLLPQILPHLPRPGGRYIEPFLGAGSVFLALAPHRALLNDACIPLVETWTAIAADPEGVFAEATKRDLAKDVFYAARAERGGSLNERAGRFIYLNRGAFNGLYRVNLKGEFNVPWGAPKTSNIIELPQLIAVARALNESRAELRSGDFEATLDEASSGDLVFVDPPYVTSHNSNGFIAYNEKIFSWTDQVRLAKGALDARRRGATVVVTNADHKNIHELYGDYARFTLERPSTLAASNAKRGRTTEVLLIGAANA